MATLFNFTSILCYDSDAPPAAPPNVSDDTRQFTQKDLNRIMAEDKRKHQDRFAELETSYQELLQNQNLTTDERDTLQTRYDDLQASGRTQAQQAEFDRKAAEKKYETELNEAVARADRWESKSKEDTVSRALVDAAAGADVFNPSHIVAMLRPDTELKDIDGVLTPMVNFPDIDEKTGENIRTLHTPLDAVKRMRELTRYANLFRTDKKGGLGGSGSSAPGKKFDLARIARDDPKEYRRLRKERPDLFD